MRFIMAGLLLILAACSIQNDLQFSDQATGEYVVPIYVGTTRNPDGLGDFDNTRSDVTHYARYDISIPPDHVAGNIEWPLRNQPNPKKDFAATAKYTYQTEQSFAASLHKQIANKPKNDRRVYVYVHGFYNSFGDGVYRAAQISHDFAIDSVVTHFAWPSAGTAFGYAQDRDALLTARDSFEDFLKTIQSAGASEIVIIAHSLGSALAMETLRSISIGGENDVPNLIKGVALIAPDLDVDLFVSQAKRIGKLPDMFIIVTSSKDYALQLSAQLSGAETRLGNIKDIAPIAGLDAVVVDISALSGLQKSNHLAAFENPDALEFLKLVSQNDVLMSLGQGGPTPDPLQSVAISVNNATRVVLSPENTN